MVFGAVGNKVSRIPSTLLRDVIMARPYHSLGRLEIRRVAIWEVPFFE